MVKDLPNEKWVKIGGYEECYAVSNLQRVKAFARTWVSGIAGVIIRSKPEVLLTQFNSRGYKRVVLTKNGKPKGMLVHRLIAKAFIPNPENKPEINHINGIPSDNRIENLEWVTPSENQIHAYKIGLSTPGKRENHSQARKVKCDTLDLSFNCIRDAGDALGIDYTTIWHICRGDRLETRGLNFRYL